MVGMKKKKWEISMREKKLRHKRMIFCEAFIIVIL